MQLHCVACEREIGSGYQTFCECGGMIDVRYPLQRVRLADSENPYQRFAELLPLSATRDRVPQAARYTPTVHAQRLGRFLGMPSLYLKDDTQLPTRSTKDRMAVVALGFLWERGVREFCTSSTGNSSTAYAHAIPAYPDMRLHLFTAERFLPRVQHADHKQVEHYCLRGGTFVEAFEHASTHAREHGLVSERGFFNLGRREGLKLAFLEAAEQVPVGIDWYVQAVSSAMGVYGTYKAARELVQLGRLARAPRLLCVQQDTCAPMVQAFAEGRDKIEARHIVSDPTGIAEAILRGNPSMAYPHVRRVVLESGGGFIAVSESAIREAQTMIEEFEGISPCFSSAAAFAGVVQGVKSGRLSPHQSYLVALTGGVRPPVPASQQITWLCRNGAGWTEDSSKEDSSKGDSSKGDSSKGDSSKEDSSKEDSSKEDSSKEDSSKGDSSKRVI
jgi:threonine synthase